MIGHRRRVSTTCGAIATMRIATPGLQGEFETKMCNRWLHSATTWLSMPAWHACADPTLTLEDFADERCYIGVDLAERDDIAAVALVLQTRRSDLRLRPWLSARARD